MATTITMRALLSKLGHQVVTANDGEHGLRVARHFHPHVVFSDIGLPGMDGYDVARRLREDEQLHGVHLVAVTGYGQSEDQRRAQEAGFDDHLTKPAAFADLKRLLSAVQASAG
jgi:CheY-like chemotaxis protein